MVHQVEFTIFKVFDYILLEGIRFSRALRDPTASEKETTDKPSVPQEI